MKNINSIDDIFDSQGRCILFFATQSNTVGHWECLNKQGNNIFFFDSYGLNVDDCKEYVQKNLLIKLNEYPNYLTNLLKKSGYNIYHNVIKYQKMEGNISTCGRHCCLRLLHKNMNTQEYKNYMDNLVKLLRVNSFDEAVTEYIYKKYKF